jgi:hypothetical protein
MGKISELCHRLGKEVPFGLASASLEALYKHHDMLKGQIAARAAGNLGK